MNTPNFINDKFVDERGYLTSGWKSVLSILISQLQQNFSKEGLMAPVQNTSVINSLAIPEKNGATFYDLDDDKPKIIVAGTVKEIQVV